MDKKPEVPDNSDSMTQPPSLQLFSCPRWSDYELLDSGDGKKLERFGPYQFIRPEPQALWKSARSQTEWAAADAEFGGRGDEEGGRWEIKKRVPERWRMSYHDLSFWAQLTSFRHLGVFPEQASQWDWVSAFVKRAGRSVNVLDLFAYTGLATLSAAAAGASVTYVDGSKKVAAWAKENQALSRLEDQPIRWIVDDALKFVRREARRGVRYDGIILDPPKFGRGPRDEVWKLDEMLPELLAECSQILTDKPLFVLITAYAIRASAISLYYAVRELMSNRDGETEAGELVIPEKSGGRRLSTAIVARWSAR